MRRFRQLLALAVVAVPFTFFGCSSQLTEDETKELIEQEDAEWTDEKIAEMEAADLEDE